MKKIITLFTAIAILFDIFSPLRLIFEGGKALTLLMAVIVIMLYDKLYTRKTFRPIALYVLTCLVLMAFGNEYFAIPQLISFLFAYACFEHFMIRRDYKYAIIVLSTLYFTLMFIVIISIPLFISMPNLSRLMIDADENGITDPIMYWTIQYSTIHSLPVYSVPLFYLIKTSKHRYLRIFSLFSVLAIVILMFFADATTALLLTLGLFVVLFFLNPNQTVKHNLFKFGIIGAGLLIFLNKAVIIYILSISQPIFAGSSTYHKIDEMILALSGRGLSGDMEGREELLDRSINSFLSNPLFPEMDMNNMGLHNFLIDQIVALGLLLGTTFVWFVIERVKRPLRFLNNQSKHYYWLCVIALLFMGLSKSFFLLFPTCCIVPMIFIVYNNSTK